MATQKSDEEQLAQYAQELGAMNDHDLANHIAERCNVLAKNLLIVQRALEQAADPSAGAQESAQDAEQQRRLLVDAAGLYQEGQACLAAKKKS